VKRSVLLATAVVSLTMALILVVNAGLPERAAYTGQPLPGERSIAPELNAIAPPFEHLRLDGDTVNLPELYGSPVIINFWATWCGPCRLEMPVLQSIYDEFRIQGLRVLAVNLGESEDIVRDWVAELGLTLDIVPDTKREIETLYQLRGTPSTYVVAPNGIITQIFYGPVSESQLREAIASYVS
jgi:thiol-disulfide isomerase/thioredoxin